VSTKRKPRFTIETMRGVVEHYRAYRMQPSDCTECQYIGMGTEECPPGFEEMREAPMYISQCDDHNKPLYQWLHKVDTDKAARWLVKKANASPHLLQFPTIAEEMRRALT
jgi:hypothetical protein